MKRENRKRKYLLGWEGESQCVYGSRFLRDCEIYEMPMTLKEALREQLKTNKIGGVSGKFLIYELVPIES